MAIVAVFGLIGNLTSMVVLARPKIREVAFNQLLTCLCIVDTLFLACNSLSIAHALGHDNCKYTLESYHLSRIRPICLIFNKTQYYQYSNMTNIQHIRHIGEVLSTPICDIFCIFDIFGILEHIKLPQYVEYVEYAEYVKVFAKPNFRTIFARFSHDFRAFFYVNCNGH